MECKARGVFFTYALSISVTFSGVVQSVRALKARTGEAPAQCSGINARVTAHWGIVSRGRVPVCQNHRKCCRCVEVSLISRFITERSCKSSI